VKYSFFSPYDIYFVWTSTDYYSVAKGDYTVKALTESHVCLIEDSFPYEFLDDLIAQEVLRLFSGAKDTNLIELNGDYSGGINEESIIQNILKAFRGEPFNVNPNPSQEELVKTVNVGLGGIPEEYAGELIDTLSELSSKLGLGIAFNVLEYFNGIPETFNAVDEYNRIRGIAQKESDAYVIFVGNGYSRVSETESGDNGNNYTDLRQGFDTSRISESIIGEAYSSKGLAWFKITGNNIIYHIKLIGHEICHLIKCTHIYLTHAMMNHQRYPNSEALFLTAKTWETIYENRHLSRNDLERE
tara:strand:+ start:321 stop:1223 length:903 start_codon:yes stop_codon:yes gene_type:complete